MTGKLNHLFAIRPEYSEAPCRVGTPVFANGESVVSKRGTAQNLENTGEVLATVIVDLGNLCDFLLTLSPPCLVISRRVFDLCQEHFEKAFAHYELQFDYQGEANRDYLFLVPVQRYVIVDFDQAKIAYFDDIVDPRYARRVLEWVIDETKIPELEVFSDRFGLTIVTESLKNRLEEVGVTGSAFISLASLKEPLLGT